MQIGLQLGADVPFFLFGGPAWAQGVGEQLQPVCLPLARFLVFKSPTGLDTAQIFRAADLKRDTKPDIVRSFAASPFAFGKNDLQPVAERFNPQVARGIQLLQTANLNARMTGSGSAVFAHLKQEQKGLSVTPPPGWQLKECESLEAHPLAGWASGKISE